MKTSWKTTAGGVLALLGAAMQLMPDDLVGQALKPWAGFVSALGAGIVGLSARDNGVSSEDAGVKRPTVTTTTNNQGIGLENP